MTHTHYRVWIECAVKMRGDKFIFWHKIGQIGHGADKTKGARFNKMNKGGRKWGGSGKLAKKGMVLEENNRKWVYLKGNIKYITITDMASAITQYWELQGQ